MAYQSTPLDTAGNALRYTASINLAIQIISTGSGLSDEQQIDQTIFDLAAASEWLSRLGGDAIDQAEIEHRAGPNNLTGEKHG